jgi:glycosyltransferase involved in cell wall biosynthesis
VISFIVIGKNEGWRLTKCLTSINTVIKEDGITDYEIIYVDSKSTDDSVERALCFKDVQVYEITGECNAAIARNIGALEAKGDILFFIDGDMEVLPGFLPSVMTSNNKLLYPFMSGIFEDYIYDENWNFIEIQKRLKISETLKDRFETTTGGLFIIESSLWKSVGGMDNRLVRSQDFDLGLRLSNKGIPLLRKPFLLALHHTLSYFNVVRKNSYATYSVYSAILARKNIMNKKFIHHFIRTDYSAIILFFSLFFSIIISPFFMFFYSLICLLRSYKIYSKSQLNYFNSFWILLCRDVIFILAFFSIYPKMSKMEYEKFSS